MAEALVSPARIGFLSVWIGLGEQERDLHAGGTVFIPAYIWVSVEDAGTEAVSVAIKSIRSHQNGRIEEGNPRVGLGEEIGNLATGRALLLASNYKFRGEFRVHLRPKSGNLQAV